MDRPHHSGVVAFWLSANLSEESLTHSSKIIRVYSAIYYAVYFKQYTRMMIIMMMMMMSVSPFGHKAVGNLSGVSEMYSH